MKEKRIYLNFNPDGELYSYDEAPYGEEVVLTLEEVKKILVFMENNNCDY